MANEGIEQVELTEPWKAVEQAGGRPVLIAPESGTVQAFDHLDKADEFDVDQTFDGADVGAFDALVLPGGVANPDNLRTHEDAVAFVRDFVGSGKPVAAICHAAVDAGRGRRRARQAAHLVAEPADRPAQRGRASGPTRRSSPTATSSPAASPDDLPGLLRGADEGRGSLLT